MKAERKSGSSGSPASSAARDMVDAKRNRLGVTGAVRQHVLTAEPGLAPAPTFGAVRHGESARPARQSATATRTSSGCRVNNTDVTLFKRIPLKAIGDICRSGGRSTPLQSHAVQQRRRRPEFSATGEQVNPTFGQVIATRSPRVVRGAVRFVF
jgi:hypothetical protein